ncbi:MAG: lipoprotein insertase outer membrane protein LolB [Steroidobacteraceae bacterium]
MRLALPLLASALLLAGCATARLRPTAPLVPWNERATALEHARTWQLDGRAAAALGQQGWQASLDWRQKGSVSELHLAGPFGVGALALSMSPEGLSLNGAPPTPAVTAQLEARLGFELPLEYLRFWLLGIPNPDAPFEITRNAQDRAQHLSQAGWSIDYDQYRPEGDDELPARMVLSKAGARVRIAVDRWEVPQ